MEFQNKRRGFSLVELLVALVVLFAVSTIVLQTAPGQAGQKNLEATHDKLEAIRVAVVGRKNSKGQWVNGYRQDVGALPKKYGNDEYHHFNGLIEMPAGMSAYGPKYAESPDTDIQFHTGWRGPYLDGVFPGEKIVDGWGNALKHGFGPDGSTITSIQSHGGPDAPYDDDYPKQAITFDANDYSSDVSGQVSYDNLLGFFTKIKVRVYEPDPDTGEVIRRTVTGTPSFFSSGPPIEFNFPDVSTGMRPVRARLYLDFFFFQIPVSLFDTTWEDVPAGGTLDDIELSIDPLVALAQWLDDNGYDW